ncbi:unnamed protein product, partial [Hapterophycus canaliculatus]
TSSTHAGRSIPSEQQQQQQQQWKSVYRDFLLHVHPDFFQDSTLATERAVNEKSLKAFSQHLDQLQLLGHDGSSSGDVRRGRFGGEATSQLVFFLKQAGDPVHDPETSGNGDGSRLSPRKVLLPLESHHQMATQIFELGITSTSIPPPTPRDASTNHPNYDDGSRNANSSSSSSSSSNSEWHIWGDQFFGGSAANRAWDKAASARRRRHPHGRSAFSGHNDRSREGRQRTTEWGAAFERANDDAFTRLGHVLATEDGRALVRERRASSRSVRRLVDELRREFGFGDFTFSRCGWSKSNLCVALSSLLETCRVNRSVLRVPHFGGLEVTLRNDPSVLHKGEIQLCPADVPNQWMSVLQSVTPTVLSAAEKGSRELSKLQDRASRAVRGARLSRGLSCSKSSRYRQFLEEICESAEADPVAGGGEEVDGTATGVALGDWSVLRCKVEEGFSRVSKVLEDGTVQVGSGMSLRTLRRCLGRDLATASAATAESLRLAAVAAATAKLCRQSLGLEDIERSRHATPTFSQMLVACEALIRFSESAKSGDLEAEALAARRRLRGHSVRVVGSSRVGVSDGVTEDGEIVIRWDWAEE